MRALSLKLRFRRIARRLWKFLQFLLLLGGIVFLWAASFFAFSLATRFSVVGKEPETDALMTVLFGASTIALFMFSAIFTLLGLVQWNDVRKKLDRVDNIDREIQEKIAGIEKTTTDLLDKWGKEVAAFGDRQIKPLEVQMKARVHSTLGYALGEMSMTQSLKIKNRDQLEEAVHQCQIACDLLKDFRGMPVEYMALNNLIFYLSFFDDNSRRDFILDESRRLLRAAQEHNFVNFILTACRAGLKFSSNEKERADLIEILKSIPSNSRATARERREAKIHLDQFSGRQ
jgi:hypothetical protein